MKYFSPSYWFKLWVLSAPLFNDETKGINAKSINNKKIKDWASNNTSLESINQEMSYTNSSTNYQPYNLNQVTNQNINPIYQTEIETSTHKHRHEKRRHKRQNRRNINNIVTNFLEIKNANSPTGEDYLTSLGNIIQRLIDNQIIIQLSGEPNVLTAWYVINPIFLNNNNEHDENFFRVPINLQYNDVPLELVLRSRDFYFQGFILNNNRYFYFNDSTITNINNMIINRELSIDSRYHSVNLDINWNRIIEAFNFLTNFNDNNYNNYQRQQNLIPNMMVVALVTSESLRFQRITNMINILEHNPSISYNWNNEIFPIVRTWDATSRNIVVNDFDNWPGEDVRTLSVRTTEYCLIQMNSSIRKKREINNYICSKEIYYDNNQKSKTFTLKYDNTYNHIITLNFGKNNPLNFDKISVLNEEYPYVKASWGNTPYFGTKFSEFLKDKKISNLLINEKITENSKKEFFNNHNFYKLQEEKHSVFLGRMAAIQSIHPTFYWENNNYYLQFLIHQYGESWESSGGELWMNIGNGIKFDKSINVDSNNIETQIQAPKNCEKIFYYDNGNKDFKTSWSRGTTQDFHVFTLNLGKNNPLDFDKIFVLNEQNAYTKTSWGNDPYWGTKFSDFLKNEKIHNFIANEKINENKKEDFFNNHNFHKLQDFCENGNFDDKMCTVQSIYPTFYWENENYYLQFFIQQWTWSQGSIFMDFGARWMNLGDGIKLQKENCNESRKKRNIESNENKWSDDFTKAINNEQHLSIDNKTNFVASNITSL